MPELPEVETTRRGLAPHLEGRRIAGVTLRRPDLRWPIPREIETLLPSQTILSIRRRAKYLLMDTDAGTAIWHLGMSGSMRVLPASTPVLAHDHVDVSIEDKGKTAAKVMRFNDPRRFGCLLWQAPGTVHPLLATRGVPGTHDVELAQAVIDSLADAGSTQVPVFDKAIDDRRPRSQWRTVEGPLRAVILEGWCVGAKPESAAQLAAPVNALERDEDSAGRWRGHVNEALQGRYAALFARLSPLVLLAAPSFEVVLAWRTEQEHKLRERLAREGGDGSRVMGDAAIARFISHYERITRHILAEMPARADHLIALDAARHARLLR